LHNRVGGCPTSPTEADNQGSGGHQASVGSYLELRKEAVAPASVHQPLTYQCCGKNENGKGGKEQHACKKIGSGIRQQPPETARDSASDR